MKKFIKLLLTLQLLIATLVSGQTLFAQSNATNYLPKFTNAGGTTTNSSALYQSGVNIGLGTTAPLRQLHIHNSTYQDCSAVITQSGTGLMAGGVFKNCSSSAIQLTNYYSGTTNTDGFLIDLTNTDASIRLLETGNLSLYTGTGSNLALRLSESNVSIGNDKFYLNSAGNIGIGTISPSQKLHVAGNSYITGNLGLGTAPTTNKLSVVGSSLFDGNATIGATGTYSSSLYVNGACKIQRHADADYGYEEALRIKVNQNFMQPISVYQVNSSGTEIQTFRVYGNGSGFFAGRVGIGTTAYPAEMLHVVGNSYITGNVGIG
ncbi:MAG: hypothetical protein LBV69_03715, partial [Bacteroidales bacterium]|nr:hypothetical protein [Bacteroidales bacterium]